MDRKRYERQIRLVLAIYRTEVDRRDRDEMVWLRDRSEAIFTSLEGEIGDDPELTALLREARREIWPSASGGLREHAVDDGGQFGDGERLG